MKYPVMLASVVVAFALVFNAGVPDAHAKGHKVCQVGKGASQCPQPTLGRYGIDRCAAKVFCYRSSDLKLEKVDNHKRIK